MKDKNKAFSIYVACSLALFCVLGLMMSCGHANEEDFDPEPVPRDTVQAPDHLSGEDSIAYIENVTVQSPMSVEVLLGLAEVHTIDEWINDCLDYRTTAYNRMKESGEDESSLEESESMLFLTHLDSCALRLANRFMRMYHLVQMKGGAMDELRWAEAVNISVDDFYADFPEIPRDSAVNDILRLINKFTVHTQKDLNFESYIASSISYYHTIEAYRQFLDEIPDQLSAQALEEYQAWRDFNNAWFAMWRDVSYTQFWYSAKPMEIEGYYKQLALNRCAELAVEKEIILTGKPYIQRGKTVTTKQWEKWIEDHSRPMDYEDWLDNYRNLPTDSTVTACVTALTTTFSRWSAARQAMVSALPADRAISYDNITADIHSRLVGTLTPMVSLEE